VIVTIELFSPFRLIPFPLPIPLIQWFGIGDTDLLRGVVGIGVPSK